MMLHIAQKTDWEQARAVGYYMAPTQEQEGFIHCSYVRQILPVANARFRGQTDLVMMVIDEQKVTAEIKEENLEGGRELYPHIYGPLDIEAVVEVCPFLPGPDGSFELPVIQSKSHDKKCAGSKV